MSISLVTRSGNGAPVTAVQNDANMSAIQTAVNTNISDISNRVTSTALNAYFEGISGGKQQVDWARITNKPANVTTRYPFRADKTSSAQTISATGNVTVDLNSETFDPNGAFDAATKKFIAPVTGIYFFEYSAQVALDSGSPTAVSIIATLMLNGGGDDNATLDNTGTGIRIYKGSCIKSLTAGDSLWTLVQFSFSGTAQWQVSSTNTHFSGFLIQ